MKTITDALQLVDVLLDKDTDRHKHSLAVAVRAAAICLKTDIFEHLGNPFIDLVNKAAVLHEVGYARRVEKELYPPVDAYNLLLDTGWGREVASVVLQISFARDYARHMGFGLERFYADYKPNYMVDEAIMLLTYCDFHTLPNGEYCTLQERYSELEQREGTDSASFRTMKALRPLVDTLVDHLDSQMRPFM